MNRIYLYKIKNYLYEEVEKCFISRFKMQIEGKKRAFQAMIQHLEYIKQTKEKIVILKRLSKAVKTTSCFHKISKYNRNIDGLFDVNVNSKTPFISIVIPTYNCSCYLKEAINNALAQQYENLEILISAHPQIANLPDIGVARKI